MRLLGVSEAFRFILLSCSLAACSNGGGSGNNGDNEGGEQDYVTPLVDQYPIDGVFDLADFAETRQTSVDLRNLSGDLVDTVAIQWVIVNDDLDIYIAVQWPDPTHNHSFDADSGPTNFGSL